MNKIIKAIIAIPLSVVVGYNLIILSNINRPFNKNSVFSDSKVTGVSCMIDNSYKKKYTYKACDKEFKVEDWIRFGDAQNDDKKVVVWLHGGPMPFFSFSESKLEDSKDIFNEISNSIQGYTSKDAPWDIAVVKEIWHMKHNLLLHGMDIDPDEAKLEQTEYMEIVNKIVRHYQNQGRQVVLAGHSYGGNQINDFLRVNGTTPDGIVSLVGRINGPKSQAELWKKRIVTNYKYDGSNNDSFFTKYKIKQAKWSSPQGFIVTVFDGATLDYDYTKEIDPKKLTHNNILWYSSQGDLPAGSFSQKERDFARKYGHLIYKTYQDSDKLYKYLEKLAKDVGDDDVIKDLKDHIPHDFPFLADEIDIIFHKAFDNEFDKIADK